MYSIFHPKWVFTFRYWEKHTGGPGSQKFYHREKMFTAHLGNIQHFFNCWNCLTSNLQTRSSIGYTFCTHDLVQISLKTKTKIQMLKQSVTSPASDNAEFEEMTSGFIVTDTPVTQQGSLISTTTQILHIYFQKHTQEMFLGHVHLWGTLHRIDWMYEVNDENIS